MANVQNASESKDISNTAAQLRESKENSLSKGTKKVPKRWKKPLLTDNVKKKNHISSEHRRREMIKQKHDSLIKLVPALSKDPEQVKGELIIYPKTYEYLVALYEENLRLRKLLANSLVSHSDSSGDKNIIIREELIWEKPDSS
ncbi:hypothetical protein ACO0RG_003786 [Hanseniaspora osmophila]|uniref:BHLH domain-containing protein n=1 Tax=Hanseniaspora osmophila TaxID=56408 RepID=A0A1E5RER2_9ASCO|nr:hypothetical protein AWRI3579_g2426 [Hanseniaspora osmophila]